MNLLPALTLTLAQIACAASPDVRELERRVYEAINHQRRSHNLKPLEWNEAIADQARLHSIRMRDLLFFEHRDPERGSTPQRLTRARITWRAVGENIFEMKGSSDPVRTAVEGWMKSSGHRQNILNRVFTETGVGVAVTRDGTYFFTQIFYTPRPPEPAR